MNRFAGWRSVPIREINEYVLIETAFRETHSKTVLHQAEKDGAIAVDRPSGKRTSYWNEGTLVTFLSSG